MTVQKQFETLLNGFPGIISVSSFGHLEKWANKTADQWNRLSPYDDQLRSAVTRQETHPRLPLLPHCLLKQPARGPCSGGGNDWHGLLLKACRYCSLG
jgi:hypothetical protein